VESNEVTFTTKFHPVNFSGILDCHGVTKNLDSEEAFKKQWNRNGFYFHSATECGIDYNHVISISTPLNHQIAEFILSELQRAGKDNYQNRISAALNFVQYIPYGVPDFDTGEYIYGGISLPHESVAISYADCDSKAAMMAGILLHLISAENMVLVACVSGTTPHMVIGVSDLPYPGQRVDYKGKSFLLVETTTPATLHEQDSFETNTNIEIVPIIT
jgi:hypothetical protein